MAALISSFLHIYTNGGSFSESKTKEPKSCKKCPIELCLITVRDTPALKRHCYEVHKQDIDGNPISIELFPCRITTCHKHRNPFKRRDKLAQHIRAAHPEVIKRQETNAGISTGEKDTALTTNNTAKTGNYFGGNGGAANLMARAVEVDVCYPPAFEEQLQSAPVTETYEMASRYVRSHVLQPWEMFRTNVFRLQIYH